MGMMDVDDSSLEADSWPELVVAILHSLYELELGDSGKIRVSVLLIQFSSPMHCHL